MPPALSSPRTEDRPQTHPHPRPHPFFRLAALLFAAFLVFIVITADMGIVGRIFGWLVNYPNGDKVGHFVLYGVMALLLCFGFPTTRVRIGVFHPLKSGLVLAALAALEEISQFFFPRTPSWLDLAAGLAGVIVFGEIGAWVVKRVK